MSDTRGAPAFRAPEGDYRCADWMNPLLNKCAAMNGPDPSQAPNATTANSLYARIPPSGQVPRVSLVTLPPGARHAVAENGTYYDVNTAQHTAYTGSRVLQSRSPAMKRNRPRQSLKTGNNLLITRAAHNQDLGKALAQRTEPCDFVVRGATDAAFSQQQNSVLEPWPADAGQGVRGAYQLPKDAYVP